MSLSKNDSNALISELASFITRARRVRRLVPVRQQWWLAAAVILMAIVGAANARIPLLLGDLVDAMVVGEVRNLSEALPVLALLAGIYLLREALQVARKIIVERTCTSVEKETRVQLVSRLLRYDLDSLAAERVGALHGRLHRSVEGMVKILKLLGLEFLPVCFTALFALAAVLLRRPDLGALMAGVVPVGATIVLWQIWSQKGIRLELLRTKETMDGTIVEQLGGIEYVRAVNTVHQEVAKVESISEQLRTKEMRHHVAMAFFDCAKAVNEGGFHVAVIGYSIALAASGAISTGDILSYSVLFISIVQPLREVARIIDEAHESSLRVGDLVSMLDHPADISFTTSKDGQPILSDDTLALEVKDLTVEYNTALKRVVGLAGVSLAIRRGEIVGLAGTSGSGKTTLLKVMLRLVHPTTGSVRLGGVAISETSRETVGRLIGFVSQTPFLFAGTVAENIAYGAGGVTLADVKKAASLARIDDEIMALPHGYDTMVSERGQNFSGGQRQRIALARVFLKNPPILVLDEATAALDNLSERAVLDALANAMVGRTVLMVAHRLSTLRRADRILVFEHGAIAEEGTYQQLETRGGLFTRLLQSTRDADDRGQHP